jgi:formylglycine-generating enzyme required for sulfatase activity
MNRRHLFAVPGVLIAAAAALLLYKQNPVRYREVRADVVPIEPEMVTIPAGPFRMGNPGGNPTELPLREVWLGEFAIGRHEVSNEEYRRFADATGRPYPPDPVFAQGQDYFVSRPRHPVVEISWSDAAAYCRWLADRTGKRYRLPTEAEWEKACRGGQDGAVYPWGDERREDLARMNLPETAGTVAVGSHPPNGYGLHDMAGNVNEMTSDWYDERYYRRAPGRDPAGPSGLGNYLSLIAPLERSRLKGRCKTMRGGSYRAVLDHSLRNPDGRFETPVQCGAREYLYQQPYTHFDLGFRVALGPGK